MIHFDMSAVHDLLLFETDKLEYSDKLRERFSKWARAIDEICFCGEAENWIALILCYEAMNVFEFVTYDHPTHGNIPVGSLG